MSPGPDPRRMALLLAVAVFALTASMGAGLSLLIAARLDQAVAPDRAGLIDTASGLVQQSLRRGLDHGLPLRDLPGIPSYLEELRGRLPGVTRIDLALGAAMFQTGESRPGDQLEERALDLPGQAARISFHSGPPQQPLTSPAALGRLFGIAVLAGLLAGFGYLLSAGRALQRAERRLLRRLADLSLGDFRAEPQPGPSALPADQALSALQTRLEPLNLRHSLLLDHAAGLRAIDHDGRLSAQVDQVMADLPADWRFSAPDRADRA